jgi:NADH-quinone oxidoreductase subunit J
LLVHLAFWIFASILVASAVMVVTARNPVHSVLFLILGFFNAAGLFLLMGAEFLAMILVIVYVGAVAVLFLFVVMMLDVNFAEMREGFQKYAPIGAVIGGILCLQLVLVGGTWITAPEALRLAATPQPSGVNNAEALGRVLYTPYIFLFQASGMVLLVAMIGAIVLTLRERPGTRRQKVADQIARKRADTLVMVKIAPGDPIASAPPLPKPAEKAEHAPAQHGNGHGHGERH